jgi:Uncharacterized protein conserved in bacteria
MDPIIYVDADSLPQSYRNIILKRASGENIRTVFVADRALSDVELFRDRHAAELRNPYRGTMEREELRKIKSCIFMEVVSSGANSADDRIIDQIKEGDLIISHDIPLLFRAVEKGAFAIDDRGGSYTEENIRARLSERNAMSEFRALGLNLEHQGKMGERVKTEFANAFDKAILKLKK